MSGQQTMSSDDQNDSFGTAASSIQLNTSGNTSLSVSSENSLFVPGKLHQNIANLKQCYTAIIHAIDPSKKPALDNSSTTSILMLDRVQMKAGIKANKINLEPLKKLLIDLLECVRPVCLPDYICDMRPKKATQENELHDLTNRVENLCSQNRSDFDLMKAQFEGLKSSLSHFENGVQQHIARPPPTTLIDVKVDHTLAIDHGIGPFNQYIPDFILEEKHDELMQELSSLPYTQSKGRSTVKFGEHYTYNGSKEDSIADFPACIATLLGDLNTRFTDPDIPPLNSCLVTKYSGPNSYIPAHSDDERSIHHGSNIITLSLGRDATVCFSDIHSGTTQKQLVGKGSLYSMTRASQALFKHSIPADTSWSDTDTRISLTFRSVHWRNNNSTAIMGDSNTLGLKFAKFGNGASESDNQRAGTFGNAMPGTHIEAYKVEELDPYKCIGHNNIVIHCGINNIRLPDDIESDDIDEFIREVYVNFKTKISDIVHVNKRASVHVCCLLPTKLVNVNRRVKCFNNLLHDDLSRSFNNVKIIYGVKKFADSLGKLDPKLSREFNKRRELDHLHLNEAGLRVLSVNIKSAIFFRKVQGGDTGGSRGTEQHGRSPGNSHSRASRGTSRWGRGGRTNRGHPPRR
jgi:alkylated DNA repair dioxygenase AlkB